MKASLLVPGTDYAALWDMGPLTSDTTWDRVFRVRVVNRLRFKHTGNRNDVVNIASAEAPHIVRGYASASQGGRVVVQRVDGDGPSKPFLMSNGAIAMTWDRYESVALPAMKARAAERRALMDALALHQGFARTLLAELVGGAPREHGVTGWGEYSARALARACAAAVKHPVKAGELVEALNEVDRATDRLQALVTQVLV